MFIPCEHQIRNQKAEIAITYNNLASPTTIASDFFFNAYNFAGEKSKCHL
jgi:hypothetical protein